MIVIGINALKVIRIVFLCCSLCFKFVTNEDDEEDQWNYHDTDRWRKLFPSCDANRQSPININEIETIKDTRLQSFAFIGYEKYTRLTISNNGHSIQARMDPDTHMSIMVGNLSGRYISAQFHFHWGDDNSWGSEHIINARSFPMEMHIVHYAERYNNLSNALQYSDGLAVLGFMFEISNEDNYYFEPIINCLYNCLCPGSSDRTRLLQMFTLLPENLYTYYRYNGSLTTPPCSESVIWTIFNTPIRISERQMRAFRNIYQAVPSSSQNERQNDLYKLPPLLRKEKKRMNVGNHPCQNVSNQEIIQLVNNYRPVQSLFSRKVYERPMPLSVTKQIQPRSRQNWLRVQFPVALSPTKVSGHTIPYIGYIPHLNPISGNRRLLPFLFYSNHSPTPFYHTLPVRRILTNRSKYAVAIKKIKTQHFPTPGLQRQSKFAKRNHPQSYQ